MCRGENETTDRERGDDDGSPVSSWRRKLCRHKTWFPFFFRKKKKSWGFINSNNINNNTTQTEDEGYPSAALFCFCCRVVGCSFLFSIFFLYFLFFFLFQPATTPTLYTMISHFRLSETGWDISFFFLWERGFRRDINVYKVIKFKPGEERKRKKTGISTDRRRRTYIWVRDDQQLYRKHFFQKWTIYPEV